MTGNKQTVKTGEMYKNNNKKGRERTGDRDR